MSETVDTQSAAEICQVDQFKRVSLLNSFAAVRRHSNHIASMLQPEDCVVQSMPDASPTRWHLAHTTWFFETFVLKAIDGYECVDAKFEYLLNSYYNSVGDQFPRDRRGLLSRPTVDEVLRYRQLIDEAIERHRSDIEASSELRSILQTGLHHEQQHQELMLTDIKHVFWSNPLGPAMMQLDRPSYDAIEHHFVDLDEHIEVIGHEGDAFCFDNELPSHHALIQRCGIGNRLVTNLEWIEFVESGGYETPGHWLAAGWSWVESGSITHPLYWRHDGSQWQEFTMAGWQVVDPHAPVSHVSYFEADAYARYRRHRDSLPIRLPTEFEWEAAVKTLTLDDFGNAEDRLANGQIVHPSQHVTDASEGTCGWYGAGWQWTSSSYAAYPGYDPPRGAIGEYNGKFMCNQYVLRGSSCATSAGHARRTYRNFFPVDARWQFTGLRLAIDR